jgi:hypothetical protein
MRFIRSLLIPNVLLMALTIIPSRAHGQGAVVFNPTVGTLPDGVGLSTTPAVSADRRYVRISLAFQSQTIGGFSTFPVPAAVGGGGNGGGLGGGGLGGLGGLAGGGLAGGGLRSVGLGNGPADFASWYPDLGVPQGQQVKPPLKPLRASTSTRSKKSLPDPVIVPIKKKK